jgi:hypothetical protein
MSQENPNILRICDEGAHIDHILEGVERTVIENVRLIEIDIRSVSDWCCDMKIKHLGAFGVL